MVDYLVYGLRSDNSVFLHLASPWSDVKQAVDWAVFKENVDPNSIEIYELSEPLNVEIRVTVEMEGN